MGGGGGGGGGGLLGKIPSVGEVWIISGTTHFVTVEGTVHKVQTEV